VIPHTNPIGQSSERGQSSIGDRRTPDRVPPEVAQFPNKAQPSVRDLCVFEIQKGDVGHPPLAERQALPFCVFEMTRGRGFAPNARVANEWMPGTITKGWVSEIYGRFECTGPRARMLAAFNEISMNDVQLAGAFRERTRISSPARRARSGSSWRERRTGSATAHPFGPHHGRQEP
jgi:hypothetical protein